MCGIAGLLGGGGAGARQLVSAMTATMVHRGPDGNGLWCDEAAGVTLGHRRLSILDLSPAGTQPLASASGRIVVTYNGEIYNHAPLRQELIAAGITVRGQSDTQVIAEAIDYWGLLPALRRLAGMFALAVWDREADSLTLVRDRLGIKPLIWWQAPDGGIFFASELRALAVLPGFPTEVDPEARGALLRYGVIPAPYTILRGVHKLPPASLLVCRKGHPPELVRWWDLSAVAATADEGATPAQVRAMLESVIDEHMVADVPVGAFLSGGVDSAVVATLMARRAERPIQTFTAGFDEPGYDESAHARAVAQAIGSEHHEIRVTAADVARELPALLASQDEPFSDPSLIPTWLVSRLARSRVTVALSGDGGDELFAGYNRHIFAHRAWPCVQKVPLPLRRAAASVLTALPPGRWDTLSSVMRKRHQTPQLGEKLHKLASVLALRSADEAYERLIALWTVGAPPLYGLVDCDLRDPVKRMQLLDQLGYLPNDILAKLDRASMWASLEARVPLLDHRIVELAWRLPGTQRVRGGVGKRVLRDLLADMLPGQSFDRPKSGFAVPIGAWLRGPLAEWAQSLLRLDRIEAAGFDPTSVARLWEAHRTGRANAQYLLWPVIMMLSWLGRQG